MPKKALAVQEQTNSLIPAQGQKIMDAMKGEIPPHALDTRPGRGGKSFTYVSHGYVTEKMNDVFGPFWDCSALPVDNGKMYEVVTYEGKTNDGRPKMVKEVVTLVRLTVRIYNTNGELLEIISRDGDGGKVWEDNTTFADALQSSRSDAFKRAAFRFGRVFGLKLYYDDDERQDLWEQAHGIKPPKNLIELYARMQEVGVEDDTFIHIIGHDPSETKDFVGTWNKLVKALETDEEDVYVQAKPDM